MVVIIPEAATRERSTSLELTKDRYWVAAVFRGSLCSRVTENVNSFHTHVKIIRTRLNSAVLAIGKMIRVTT